MKNMLLLLISCIILAVAVSSVFAGGDRLRVPKVRYTAPDNDSTVDLTGKSALTFEWKGQPVPSGGRQAIRFRVYKGFSYEVIERQDLKGDVFSAEVLADKFEDGATYSWNVEQRDSSSMQWSLHDSWSFKVLKK